MRPGRLYRHAKCLDVDVFICARVGANRYRVQYWNRNWCCFQGETEVVTITNLMQWKEVV